MKPRYCLPVIAGSKDEVLETIRPHADGYDYVEIWLDYVDGADEAFLDVLVKQLGPKLIAVFRRKGLETPVMDPALRLRMLDALSGTPALTDLDVTTQKEDLEHISGSGLNLIASYHDYEATPDTLQLEAIIGTMEPYRPAVYKLSTLCRSEGDAVRLLQLLLQLKAKGVRAVVSGMGDHGAVTRVFGTLWGNEMVFAPADKGKGSAPGQLTKQQLEVIFKELDK